MKCTGCNTELTKDAKVCPNCGREVFGKPEKITGAVMLLVIIVAAFFLFGGSSDEDEPQKEEAPIVTEAVSQKEEMAVSSEEVQPATKTESESESEPVVSETAIKMVCDTMKQHTLISDIAIKVEEEKENINIAIIANAAIKPEVAKEYGEDAARMLATFSSNPQKPTKDSLGGLYDQYNLNIGVFSTDKKTIVRGAKVTASPKISW